MKKRIAATILWLYAGWYAGALVATLFAMSPALGPILGVSAAALVATDPRRMIWPASAQASVAGPSVAVPSPTSA